jgi:hypothetical protein
LLYPVFRHFTVIYRIKCCKSAASLSGIPTKSVILSILFAVGLIAPLKRAEKWIDYLPPPCWQKQLA